MTSCNRAPATRPGRLFVVSAPSGVGKTTILQAVLQQQPDLRFSVSCTTRAPRPGEVPGRHYHFLDRTDFEAGIRAGRFLEWAEVHGELYGTDGAPIHDWLQAGHDVVLDIDVQGARQVRAHIPSVLTLFILPPSLEVLAKRLGRRGTESPEQLQRRLAAAGRELQEAPCYDYIVVNDQLPEAIADCLAILRADRCSRARQGHRAKAFFHPPQP